MSYEAAKKRAEPNTKIVGELQQMRRDTVQLVELLASAPGYSDTDFNSLKTPHTVRRCRLDVLSWQGLSRFRSLPTVDYVPSRHAALPNFNDDLACKIKRQQLDVLFNPMRQFHPLPPFQYVSVGGPDFAAVHFRGQSDTPPAYHQPFHGDHGSDSSSMGGHSIRPAN